MLWCTNVIPSEIYNKQNLMNAVIIVTIIFDIAGDTCNVHHFTYTDIISIHLIFIILFYILFELKPPSGH